MNRNEPLIAEEHSNDLEIFIEVVIRMLGIIVVILILTQAVLRVFTWRTWLPVLRDRYVAQPFTKLRTRWPKELRLTLALAFASLVAFTVGYARNVPWLMKYSLWVPAIFSVNAAYGLLVGYLEESLRRLVRGPETARLSWSVHNVGWLMLVTSGLHAQVPGWLQLYEPYLAGGTYLWGLYVSIRAMKVSLFETVPRDKEQLAPFVIVILKTAAHHLITLFFLTWGFVVYLTAYAPGTFRFTQDSVPHFVLLGTYALGKLTMTAAGYVVPVSAGGHVVDAFLGVVGYGVTAFLVTSLFSLSQRVGQEKPESGSAGQ